MGLKDEQGPRTERLDPLALLSAHLREIEEFVKVGVQPELTFHETEDSGSRVRNPEIAALIASRFGVPPLSHVLDMIKSVEFTESEKGHV